MNKKYSAISIHDFNLHEFPHTRSNFDFFFPFVFCGHWQTALTTPVPSPIPSLGARVLPFLSPLWAAQSGRGGGGGNGRHRVAHDLGAGKKERKGEGVAAVAMAAVVAEEDSPAD